MRIFCYFTIIENEVIVHPIIRSIISFSPAVKVLQFACSRSLISDLEKRKKGKVWPQIQFLLYNLSAPLIPIRANR